MRFVHRRHFLAYVGGTALGAFVFDDLGNVRAIAGPLPGGTLNVQNVPKFVTALVIPPVMPQSGPNAYSIAARQFSQQILPQPFGATTVWGYGSTTDDSTFGSPAFTIETVRGSPIEVTWINELKDTNGNYLPHLLPVDPTLHWANPSGPETDAHPLVKLQLPTLDQCRSLRTLMEWKVSTIGAMVMPKLGICLPR